MTDRHHQPKGKASKQFTFGLLVVLGSWLTFLYFAVPPMFWLIAIGTGLAVLNGLLRGGGDINCGPGGPDL